MGQLEEMSIFIRIVEAGGIGKAAEQLGLAKSAVSRRLSNLETRLHTKLLIRTTRQSHLSDAGKHFYQKSLSIMADIDALHSQTADKDSVLKGTLRVTLPQSFGLMHLTPVIDQFKTAHPRLALAIDFSDSKVDLIEQGYDLAIRIGELEDSSLQAKKLAAIHSLLCASPQYLLQHGTPQTIHDLKQHQFLQYTNHSLQTLTISDPQQKKHQLDLTASITANNGVFLQQMAVSGHGIVFIPKFIAYQALLKNQLVPVLADHSLAIYSMYAIYPQNRFLSQRARSFIDFLAQHFAGEHWH